MLSQTSAVIRFFSFITLVTFFPSCFAVWNFLPDRVMVASAEETPDAKTAANTRAGSDSAKALSRLADEQLKLTKGGPGEKEKLVVAKAKLPAHSELIKPAKASDKTDVKPKSPLEDIKPIVLAQADGGQPDRAMEQLAQAYLYVQQGNLVDAALTYLEVQNDYPRSEACVMAMEGLSAVSSAIKQNTLGTNAAAEMESRAPSFASLTSIEAKYSFLSYYFERANAAKAAGAPAEHVNTMYTMCRDAAWATMSADVHHPLQMDVVALYFESTWPLGLEATKEAASALKELVATSEPSMTQWAAQYALATYLHPTRANGAGRARLYYVNMIEELGNGDVQAALADEFTYGWVKVRIEYALAHANFNIENFEAAAQKYQHVLNTYPGLGEPYFAAGYGNAFVIDRQNLDNPIEGLEAFAEYLNEYPESPFAAQALHHMGVIYDRSEDFEAAADTYRAVMQQYPGTAAASKAEAGLEYIIEFQLEKVDVAAAERDPAVVEQRRLAAVMCGPRALGHWLALEDDKTSEDDLAKLAKTDESGTSLQGLIEAAKQKQLDLVGVTVPDYKELTPPFIAHVNGNHFVLVKDADVDGLSILDGTNAETFVTPQEFSSMWDGVALVQRETAGSADEIQVAKLSETKGSATPLPLNLTSEVHPAEQTTGGNRFAGDGGAGIGNPGLGEPAIDSFVPSEGLPGSLETGWTPHGTAATDIHSPGINLSVDSFQSSLILDEVDIATDIRGPMSMSFERVYRNKLSHPREETTNDNAVWGNNIGGGWSHSFNMYLRTSTTGTPATNVVFWDKWGAGLYFTYSSTAGGFDTYVRNTGAKTTEEQGYSLKRNTSDGTYKMYLPSGLVYSFSAPSPGSNKFCRVENVTDATGNNTITFLYDGANAVGKLTKVTPPSGDDRYFQLSYSSNLITKVELKNGSGGVIQKSEYAYTASPKELTKVTDNDGNTVQYVNDNTADDPDARYITSITDKKGTATTLEWDDDGHNGNDGTTVEVIITGATGLRSKFRRNDSTGVCTVELKNAGGTVLNKMQYTPLTSSIWHLKYVDMYRDTTNYDRTTYLYASDRDLTKVQQPGGGDLVQFSYTSEGRLSTGKTGSDVNTTWSFAAGGLNPTKSTDRAGLETTYSYNSSNQLTKVQHPSTGSNGYQLTYNANGQISTAVNPSGQNVTYAYDARGRATSVKDPLNNEIKLEYDGVGNVTKATDPRNKDTYQYFSNAGCGGCSGGGLLTKVKDSLNNETLLAYDKNGNRTKVTDPFGSATDFLYDKLNRLTKIESPAGSGIVMTYEYNIQGQMTKLVDFESKSKTLYYNFQGQMTKQSDPIGDYVTNTYDNSGQISTISSGGTLTDYDYNSENRLTKTNFADGKTIKYFYDSAGRVTKGGAGSSGSTDPTETFYHATSGLVTKIRYTAGVNSSDAVYAYDSNSRLTKLTDWIDSIDGLRYAYDAAGRLTQLTDYDDSTLTYAYDAAGNVTTMTDYHGSVVNYTYTDRNELSTITAPGSKTWDYDYNSLGQPTKCSVPNGTTTEYSYDGRNRLTKIDHKDGSTVLDGYTYALDKLGSITKTTHQDNSYWDYWYDGRYRLTKAERKNSGGTLLKRWTYTYSPADNMTTKETYDGTTTQTYTYFFTLGNELTKQTLSGTDTNFVYDDWGRMTSKTSGGSTATYYWNYGDKLTKVASNFAGEGTVEYDYGGDSKRRERVSGGVTTWFNYDMNWMVLNEEDGSNNLTMTFVHNSRRPIGTVLADLAGVTPSSGTARYFSQDNVGSTRSVRGSDKSSLASYEYDPYGSDYATSGVSVTQRFTGHFWDETVDAYSTPYRYYNPGIARWSSRDPLLTNGGPNYFTYSYGNPVNFVDPDGRVPLIPAIVWGLIIAGAAGITLWGLFDKATEIAEPILAIVEAVDCGECIQRAAQQNRQAFDQLTGAGHTEATALLHVRAAKIGSECGDICINVLEKGLEMIGDDLMYNIYDTAGLTDVVQMSKSQWVEDYRVPRHLREAYDALYPEGRHMGLD